ncbi:hypothetical protein [Curtobacterium pusillum]|uniref:hypothetical protein n=1 Tax=Curtobacterium pusillum TaxID=69373 RepID=UPI0011A2EEBB|nr:hypothetical protein [Curtobacterium pusillum]
MDGLNSGPTRPPLHIFDTLGQGCVVVAIAAAVIALVGVIVWFRVPAARHSPIIVRLWLVCAGVGFFAIVFAILLLA